VDLAAPALPFNRIFLRGVGSCHAYLTLVNQHGIKKPVFHAFRWLARLYAEEIALSHGSARAKRSTQGDVRILSWNLPEVI
jgi:beta-xylosidase